MQYDFQNPKRQLIRYAADLLWTSTWWWSKHLRSTNFKRFFVPHIKTRTVSRVVFYTRPWILWIKLLCLSTLEMLKYRFPTVASRRYQRLPVSVDEPRPGGFLCPRARSSEDLGHIGVIMYWLIDWLFILHIGQRSDTLVCGVTQHKPTCGRWQCVLLMLDQHKNDSKS